MHEQADIGKAVEGDANERAAFERSLLAATRHACLVGAGLVLVLFPLWGLFDTVLEPELAPRLIRVRAWFMLPIAAAAIAIWRSGARPGPLYFAVFAMMTLPELAIAWMLPRVSHLEAYLIGFSLVIMASGALTVLPMRWTLAILAASLGFVAAMLWQHPLPTQDIVTVVFFLGTATIIAVAMTSVILRVRLTQFRTMNELESRRSETHDLLQQVMRLSNEDDLTGLPNRRCFRRELDEVVQMNQPLQAAIVDIDEFKEINDRHGHHVGDAVLVAIAQALGEEFASSGIAARLGGDEFAVLLQGDDLAPRMARVQHQVAAGFGAELAGIEIALSTGIAIHEDFESAHDLLRRADQALYRAKKTRGGLCVDREDTLPQTLGHQDSDARIDYAADAFELGEETTGNSRASESIDSAPRDRLPTLSG